MIFMNVLKCAVPQKTILACVVYYVYFMIVFNYVDSDILHFKCY